MKNQRCDNRKRTVTFCVDTRRRCSEDQGFCGSHEDISRSVPKGTAITHDESWDTLLPKFYKNNEASEQKDDPNDRYTLESLSTKSQDDQSTTDATNPVPTTSGSAVTQVYCHAVTIPIHDVAKEKSHLYVVLPLFSRKEQLTRRQLFQLGGMMALGFIFVILILAWVFSPVLF